MILFDCGGLSTSSKNNKKNGGGGRSVTVASCQATHKEVTHQMSNLQTSVDQIVNTLLGEQKPGSLERSQGLAQDIKDLKTNSKGRWSPKEKATILASAVTAVAAIIVAIFK
jgi:hypothetical protein